MALSKRLQFSDEKGICHTPEVTITQLPDPSGFAPDPLTELIRNGARKLIEQAIEAELLALLAAHADEKTADGRARLVRHGHLPGRPLHALDTGPQGISTGSLGLVLRQRFRQTLPPTPRPPRHCQRPPAAAAAQAPPLGSAKPRHQKSARYRRAACPHRRGRPDRSSRRLARLPSTSRSARLAAADRRLQCGKQ